MTINKVVKHAFNGTINFTKKLTNEQIVEVLKKQGVNATLCKRLTPQ